MLSSYSVISHAIPESTPYATDDSFNLFYSHHYQRHLWIIIFGIAFVILAELENKSTQKCIFDLVWAEIGILGLQSIGLLSGPFITAVYLME